MPVTDPLPTVTGSNENAVIMPFILPPEGFYRGNQARPIDQPLQTVTSRGGGALVEPLLVEYYGNGGAAPVTEPVKTITTKDHFALIEPFLMNIGHASAGDRTRSIDEPLSTVVTKAEHCLVSPARLDICFRMLKPHELARAQGFPDGYKILGNTAEQTKQIGNAVPVNTAKALALASMGA